MLTHARPWRWRVALTIDEPDIRLGFDDPACQVGRSGACDAAQAKRLHAVLNGAHSIAASEAVHRLLRRIFSPVALTVKRAFVSLACAPSGSASASSLTLTVEWLSAPLPYEAAPRLAADCAQRANGAALLPQRARELHARNVSVAVVGHGGSAPILHRWAFAVRVSAPRAQRGHTAALPCLAVVSDVKAVTLRLTHATAPQLLSVLAQVEAHSGATARRPHKPLISVTDAAHQWWQYAAKAVIQQMRQRQSAASVTCLRHLPAYVRAMHCGCRPSRAARCSSGAAAGRRILAPGSCVPIDSVRPVMTGDHD